MWRRLAKLLILAATVAIVIVLSWQAGELFARRRAEAAKQAIFEDNRQFLINQRDYFRPGSVFPNFDLVSIQDSTTTTLWDELRDGGMMVYLEVGCESCEDLVPILHQALTQIKRHRRVIVVAKGRPSAVRDWSNQHELQLPVFLDKSGFMLAQYDFMIIPALVVLTPDREVMAVSTGGWSAAEYARWLEVD